MKVKFIKSNEKRRLVEKLNERFGIKEIPGILIETGKEKVRGFSGSMTREEIKELGEIANVEIIGLYLFKSEEVGLRLSLDGTHFFANQIIKGVIELSDSELESWMNGFDLIIENLEFKPKNPEEFGAVVVLRHGDDFVGCGLSNGEKIFNYVPKERRIRKSLALMKYI